jgi:hypothetical protein
MALLVVSLPATFPQRVRLLQRLQLPPEILLERPLGKGVRVWGVVCCNNMDVA